MYYFRQPPRRGIVVRQTREILPSRVQTLRRSHVKRSIGFLAICVLLLGVSMKAQAPAGPPKPGPEVKRLAYYVGTWKESGKATMPDMSGPISGTHKWEWMPGGFFLQDHMGMTSSMGKETALGVLGWDP